MRVTVTCDDEQRRRAPTSDRTTVLFTVEAILSGGVDDWLEEILEAAHHRKRELRGVYRERR